METGCIAIPAKRPAEVQKGSRLETGQPRSKMLKLYEEMQRLYLLEGVSQRNQVLVRKIAATEPVVSALPRLEAVQVLTRIVTSLMLNDLEIVGWSIYLSRLLTPSTESAHLQTLTTYTAVAAKYYFDDNIETIQAYLEKSIANFTKNYNDWFRSHSQAMHISPKELNDRFNELSEVDLNIPPKQIFDYNELVEDIIESTPVHTAPETILPPFPVIPIPVKVESLELPRPRIICSQEGDEPPTPEFIFNWSYGGLGLEKIGSLTELWPDKCSPKKRRIEDGNRLP